jgi:hypothetical protein
MGHNIYVVEHVRTGKEIYVSISEIVRWKKKWELHL